MTAALEKAFAQAATLPEVRQKAFASFLMEELEFLAALDAGERAADRGASKSVDEVRNMIPKWVSKSSSRTRRSKA